MRMRNLASNERQPTQTIAPRVTPIERRRRFLTVAANEARARKNETQFMANLFPCDVSDCPNATAIVKMAHFFVPVSADVPPFTQRRRWLSASFSVADACSHCVCCNVSKNGIIYCYVDLGGVCRCVHPPASLARVKEATFGSQFFADYFRSAAAALRPLLHRSQCFSHFACNLRTAKIALSWPIFFCS